jgi:hypothetical protein
MEKVRSIYKAAGLALTLGLRLSLLLLGLYVLLQSASLRRLLRSLGWPLYAAGLVMLLLTGILYMGAQWGLNLLAPASLFDQQPGLRALLIDLAQTAGALLQSRLLVAELILLAAGVIAQLFAFGVGRWQVYRQAQAIPVDTSRPQAIKKQFR